MGISYVMSEEQEEKLLKYIQNTFKIMQKHFG